MATIGNYRNNKEFKNISSQIRTTIQSAFCRNNVIDIETVAEAYSLALRSPGTIELTGMPI